MGEESRVDRATRVPLEASWAGLVARPGFSPEATIPMAAIITETKLPKMISAENPRVAQTPQGGGLEAEAGCSGVNVIAICRDI